MKTGTILTFGGAVLAVIGGLLGLLFLKALLTDSNTFSNLLAVVILGAVPLAAGVALIGAGRKRARVEGETAERGFADLAVALAKKNGGAVGLAPICTASGLTSDEAQAKMRALTGKGLFDLDFDGNGQMVFKLSNDAGKAQLAELSQR